MTEKSIATAPKASSRRKHHAVKINDPKPIAVDPIIPIIDSSVISMLLPSKNIIYGLKYLMHRLDQFEIKIHELSSMSFHHKLAIHIFVPTIPSLAPVLPHDNSQE